MQLADPEAFKAAEEAVSEPDVDIQELPFVNVLRHLAGRGVSVPTLHYYDTAAGLLYLEDFGDVTLYQACEDKDRPQVEPLYAQAIDTLVDIHLRGTFPADPHCLAFQRVYREALFIWEFDHFLEYGVVARHGKPMCANDDLPIRETFQMMAQWLASQPRVLTHRDYHSRNLLVQGDRLGVIDFQDALLGPATYDLASLLRDSYRVLEEALIEKMINRYCVGMCAGLDRNLQETMGLTDRRTFQRLFDWTSIQRNLKAAGRFVYIDRVKQNPKFLEAIPRTLGYVRSTLGKYPELRSLEKHLAPYLHEWQ